jgi:hypothetical protein
MVIGSGGVFVIDSKQYRGLRLDPTGAALAWPLPLAATLQAVSFEADQAALVLTDPDVVVVPIVAAGGRRPGVGRPGRRAPQVIGHGVYCLARIQNDRGGWQPRVTDRQ